jgi:hypothetical protein
MNKKNHFPLKSFMIDFLYLTIERKDKVVIQKVVAEPNTFLISQIIKHSMLKITTNESKDFS